jgi:amidohydrolase
MHPELGFEEYRTAEVIETYLGALGIETKRMANTGVVGVLNGTRAGKTLMLRADMDALPIKERASVPYASVHEGRMHACGHDGHMAILLVAAKILSEHRDKIFGNIKFVFQPNEEGSDSGAAMLIKEGVLKNPDVDAAMGLHLMSALETGQVAITQGCVMADVVTFNLQIKGVGGHTALPHQSVDPVMVAANIILNAQMIQTRQIDVLKPTSIVFGKIEAGTGPNIIPEQAELQGTIRCLYNSKEPETPCQKFEKTVQHICSIHGARYVVDFVHSAAAVINEPQLYPVVKTAAKKSVVTKGSIVDHTTMIAEDFGYFGHHVPCFFYFIGTGNKKIRTDYPHHHPEFNIDEDALETGVEMQVRSAIAFFEN